MPSPPARRSRANTETGCLMIVSRRERAWADGRRRLRIRWCGLARLRTSVLVVAAALFGAALSAAVLVGFWDKEVGSRHAAETRLATSRAHARALAAENTRLRTRLLDSRAISARLEQASTRLRAAAQTLLRENARLMASANRLQGRGGSLERRAVSVSRLAAALGNDLVSTLAYITNTSVGSLDPSYLKAQLDYLQPTVASVRSAAETLGADAGSYTTAVDRFTTQAAAYATALRRLARERANAR
jgi:murein L,D-transpeptidase YcbB/YkuD